MNARSVGIEVEEEKKFEQVNNSDIRQFSLLSEERKFIVPDEQEVQYKSKCI